MEARVRYSEDSSPHDSRTREPYSKQQGGWSWPAIIAIIMLVGGMMMIGCALSIVAWFYAQYKMVKASVSWLEFGLAALKKFANGENPFKDAHTPGGVLTNLGLRKAGEYYESYMEKRHNTHTQPVHRKGY